MSALLKDRVIMVTGAGSGIGRAAALLFAHAGAKTVVVDIVSQDGEETTRLITASGGEAIFIRANVAHEGEVTELVKQTVAHFGRLNGAFNNAGVEQCHKPLHEIDLDQWQKVIGIDLTGVFLCMKHQIPAILATGGGAIVNTSSGLGQVAIPNAAEYVTAKHGVIGLTRAAAVDYAKHGIRVNAVLPGAIMTPLVARAAADPAFTEMFNQIRAQHPIGRLGTSEEVAETALWLLSDAASFVTGAALVVDGGYLAV